jgi:acetyl esterase/lipase
VFFAVLLAALWLHGEAPNGAGKLHRAIGPVEYTYVNGGTVERHGVEVWRPNDTRKHPIVIFIHGGAWSWEQFDKAAHREDCRRIAKTGRIAVTINYTLAKSGRPSYPGVLDDIDAAVRWVGKTFPQADMSNVTLVGGSAGGHLALLYAATHPGRVKAVLSLSGPCALEKSDADLRPYVEQLLGARQEENPALWAEASPASYVSAGAFSGMRIGLIAGGHDATVPIDDAVAMYAALRDAGVAVTYLDLAEGDHCLLNAPQARDAVIDAFLKGD